MLKTPVYAQIEKKRYTNEKTKMMTLKKWILFLCWAFLFSIPSFLQAQSSIYQDTKRLASLLNGKARPTIHFDKIRSGYDEYNEFDYEFKKGYQKLKILADFSENEFIPKYRISAFGNYEFELRNNFDTLIIEFPDTTISIGSILKTEQDTAEFYRVVELSFDSRGLRISTKKRFLNPITSPSTTETVEGLFYNENLVLIYFRDYHFQDLMNLMNVHSHYLINDPNDIPTYEKANIAYRKNPYFSELIQLQEIALPVSENLLTNDIGQDEMSQDLFAYLHKNYEWHQPLYGDSTIRLQKQVSYKDIVGSYRKPIVTAKTELKVANRELNETARKRNLLDARSVAVGLSDFIAERAQEELNLTFFNRFKENLEKPSELTILFPETKELLYQFEISNYKTLLANAREAFTVDLDNLGLNFPDILELPKYRASLYNSPEVYNVSLIYSIANMAYKEIPVEDIMMAAFQRLKKRNKNLMADINLTLADHILNPKLIVGNEKKASKAPNLKVKFGTEVPLLKTYMNDYLMELDSINQVLLQAYKNVETELTKIQSLVSFEEEHLVFSHMPSSGSITEVEMTPEEDILHSKNELLPSLTKTRNQEVYELRHGIFGSSDAFLAHNREITFSGSSMYFYKDLIETNLEGKEYYVDLLKYPRIEDYESYLKDSPDEKKRILARGIGVCRHLLSQDLEPYLGEKTKVLQDLTMEMKRIKKNFLYMLSLENAAESQIESHIKKSNFLKAAIDEEIYFWRAQLQQDQTDHQIAALEHLSRLLLNDFHTQTFKESLVLNGDMQRNDLSFSFESYLEARFQIDFQFILKQAEEYLSSIEGYLKDKTDQLIRDYGNDMIDQNLYNQKKNFVDYLDHKKKFNDQSIGLEEKNQEELDQVDLKIKDQMENDPILQNNQRRLDSLGTAISNSEGIDQSTLGHWQSEFTILKEAQKSLVDQYDQERQSLIITIEEKKKEDIKAIEESKKRLDSKYNFDNIIPSIGTTPIKDVYSLSENQNLIAYHEEDKRGNVLDPEKLIVFENFEETIHDLLNKRLVSAKEKKNKIIQHLKNLESDHCQNLVNAQVNAHNLTKAMEVAIHLMYAFRDYQGIDSTLYFTDTTKVQVTTNSIDPETGAIIGMSLVDTFRLNSKPILEVTQKKSRTQWITRRKFKELQANEVEWNLFLGLLYERLNAIEDIPAFSSEGIAILATKFLDITQDMANHRTDLRIKKANHPRLISFKDYYPFIRSTVDMFNTVIQTQSIGEQTFVEAFPNLNNVPKISNEALSLYENIYVKEYGAAILNAMQLLEVITSGKLDHKEKQKSGRAINAVFTYGTFMSNMIDAESSDQVKTILKSVTLPPGSSRIKRETTSSFTFNSYLGASLARDVLIDTPDNVDAASFGAALSVPIGFTYSFSPKWIKNNSSLSLFVPLLDLGAITAFRQNPKQDEYRIEALPELKWSNLFAPGLFGVYNFANSPFSVGVGVQYGPQLRKITFETGDPISVNSFRFPMVFFNVDVPFFNLHTGTKKILVD